MPGPLKNESSGMSEILSIVIPAYQEERFIGPLLEKVIAVDLSPLGIGKEIIVVDDGSRDRTAEIAGKFQEVILHRKPKNEGKGSAVQAGIRIATGSYIMIQDADLEYDPEDYIPMLRALIGNNLDAVYGSRYLKYPQRGRFINFISSKHSGQSLPAYVGGQSLSLIALATTGHYISDTVTALKLFRAGVIRPLNLVTRGFELDHELTAKILAREARLREVPIRYYPRTKAEGKKIGARDWLIALKTFLRFRNDRTINNSQGPRP
jgi:glycosyltransferase involved in cell wall biosynthesis